jgi:hypothetical protein
MLVYIAQTMKESVLVQPKLEQSACFKGSCDRDAQYSLSLLA